MNNDPDGRGRDVPVLPRSGTLLKESTGDIIHPGLRDARGWPVTGLVDGIYIVDGILQPAKAPARCSRAPETSPPPCSRSSPTERGRE